MNNIPPKEAQKIIESGKAVVIDVRTPAEFADGHIPGARNININDSTFAESMRLLAPDTTYIVNCQSGGRSSRACAFMKDLGLVNVENLEGGFTAWKNAGLPTENK